MVLTHQVQWILSTNHSHNHVCLPHGYMNAKCFDFITRFQFAEYSTEKLLETVSNTQTIMILLLHFNLPFSTVLNVAKADSHNKSSHFVNACTRPPSKLLGFLRPI